MQYYFNNERVDKEFFDNRLEEEAEYLARINGIYNAWICQEVPNEDYERFITNTKSKFYKDLELLGRIEYNFNVYEIKEVQMNISNQIENIIKHYKEHKKEIEWGCLDEREQELIINKLSLEDMSLEQLQECRNSVVRYIADLVKDREKENSFLIMDMLSAITFVIDTFKVKMGGQI